MRLLTRLYGISNEHCATVPPERVLEDVGQLGLSVGDVATPLVGQGSYHLLEEGERFVDVECFTLNIACGLGINKIIINFCKDVHVHE